MKAARGSTVHATEARHTSQTIESACEPGREPTERGLDKEVNKLTTIASCITEQEQIVYK
jgi:hypothetical protein